MRPYPVQSFANNRELFHKFIVPFVGKFHLDYGCGNGLSTFVLALRSPLSTIVGYDPNPKTLAKAADFERCSEAQYCSTSFYDKAQTALWHSAHGHVQFIIAKGRQVIGKLVCTI